MQALRALDGLRTQPWVDHPISALRLAAELVVADPKQQSASLMMGILQVATAADLLAKPGVGLQPQALSHMLQPQLLPQSLFQPQLLQPQLLHPPLLP